MKTIEYFDVLLRSDDRSYEIAASRDIFSAAAF